MHAGPTTCSRQIFCREYSECPIDGGKSLWRHQACELLSSTTSSCLLNVIGLLRVTVSILVPYNSCSCKVRMPVTWPWQRHWLLCAFPISMNVVVCRQEADITSPSTLVTGKLIRQAERRALLSLASLPGAVLSQVCLHPVRHASAPMSRHVADSHQLVCQCWLRSCMQRLSSQQHRLQG